MGIFRAPPAPPPPLVPKRPVDNASYHNLTCYQTVTSPAPSKPDVTKPDGDAWPVFAAAVILPDDFHHPWLNDSKQLTEKKREALRPIIEREALAWAVASCTPGEIDQINILNASIEAMHRALDALKVRPRNVIIDGNRFKPYRDLPWQTFVKGDGRFGNIAAASILAKTHRDEFMRQLAADFPPYQWEINKGYPTKAHRAAIAAHGPTPHHRLTFRLLDTGEV